ncbi:hypothetical protein Tco_0580106, partial [Tanacetum coccineum]
AKTVNGEVQLQALVDGKKIIITESIVRRDLQLEDAEGVDCLPNATIFEQLTLMGYEKISQKLTFYKAFFSPQWKFLIHTILQCLSSKTTAWNEFSSTMASAIICLATNQKFNFSKYIFESMVKNLDNVGKFFMYPRFVQVFVNQQLDGLPSHKRIYVTPSHTKKIFRNMKRVGKGFSGRVTPLFPTIMVHNQEEMGEGSTMPIDPHHTPTIIQPSTSQPQKTQKPRRPKRKDTEVPQPSGPTTNVAGEVVNDEIDDSLVRAATTASSLEAEQDSGNIDKTQSKATPNEPSSPKLVQVVVSGTKKPWGIQLLRLVESSDEKGLGEEDASKQGRIADIDANKDIYLVNVYTDEDMFGVNDLDGDELVSVAEETVSSATTTTTTTTMVSDVEITLAQSLVELKSAKPKADKDKGKGIMIKEPVVEQVKPMKRLEQIRLNEELSFKLQAEEEEEERLAREKAQQMEEANIAWDDVQAKIKADYQLAQRLQAQEQEELTDEEKSRLFVQFLEQRRKHFSAKRAEEKRNRPPTRAQQRSIMCTYLKNMEGWKPKSLKNKSFANIQELFDKAMKRVNTFIDYRTELVEENSKKAEAEIAQERSSKRSEEELEQESSKKQKVEEDKETAELQSLIEIVPDEEEVTIDTIPLATKPPTIGD